MDALAGLQQGALRSGALLSLQLDLTLRCNLGCVHCYICPDRQEMLALPLVERLLEEARGLGTLFLLVSGGEPLLHPQLLPILERACRLRYAVKLSTNGTLLTAELAARLADLGLLEVGCSVYSADPQVHDRITGLPGSHARTLAGIRMLRAAGVRVQLKTMVVPANRGSWPGVVELAREHGCSLLLDGTIFPRDDGDRAHCQQQRVSPAEKRAIAAAQLAFADSLPAEQSLLSGPPRPAADDEPLCLAGRAALHVHPGGRVQPCMFWPRPLGDLHREPLTAIWRRVRQDDGMAGLVRGAMREPCRSCSLLPVCSLCPGLQEGLEGDPLARTALVCERTRAWHAARRDREQGGPCMPRTGCPG